jgi:hypothetical protein
VELASETVVGHSSTFKAQPSTNLSPADQANPFIATAPADMRMSVDDATYEDSAPSRQDLLQRAAELGPSRMTWESIVLSPTDPILSKKMQPSVVERRARFRKVVKVALGACLAFCLVATVASAFSSNDTSSSKASASTSTVGKTAPAQGVVPVEKLEITKRGKATREATATATVRHTTKKHRRR